MRHLVLHGPGDVRLEAAPARAPGPGEVLVAVEAALTGGTVWKTVARGGHARFGAPPLPLGHEAVGRVLALGEGVEGVRVGERVLPGDSAACGGCPACARGHSELCADLRWFTGMFAEQVRVPARIVAKNLQRVPEGLAPEVAALADNLASVLHGLTRTPAPVRGRALVIGTGPLGLLWCWALSRGGTDVTLAGRREAALEAARAFGARATLRVEGDRLPAAEDRFDLVVEAVGSLATWALAWASVAPGGCVNGFGGPPDGSLLPVDVRRLHYEEITLASSFHYAPEDLARALALLATPGPWAALLDPRPLDLPGLEALLRGPRPTQPLKRVLRP